MERAPATSAAGVCVLPAWAEGAGADGVAEGRGVVSGVAGEAVGEGSWDSVVLGTAVNESRALVEVEPG